MFISRTPDTQRRLNDGETTNTTRGRRRADWFQAEYTSTTNYLGLEPYNRHLRRDHKKSVTQKLSNWLIFRPDIDTGRTRNGRRAKTYNPLDDIPSTTYSGRHNKNGNGHVITEGSDHSSVAERLINTEPFVPNQPNTNDENGHTVRHKGKHRSTAMPVLSGALLGSYGGYNVDLPGHIEIAGQRISEVVETVGTTSVGALVLSILSTAYFREGREASGKYRAMPADQGVDALSIDTAFKHS